MNFGNFLLLSLLFIKTSFTKPAIILRLFLYFFYRLIEKNVIVYRVPSLKNYQMVLDLKSHMDKGIFLSGAFASKIEENLTNFLLKYLKNDSVFFDIGANSGYFSLLASRASQKGFIHAFEPVKKTYQNFKKTIQLNQITNIKLNNVCVGTKNKTVKFYVDTSSDVSSLRKTAYQKQSRQSSSQMVRLSDYCRENKIKKIDIIKIDTEGAEKEILFSSEQILSKYKPILIVEFSSDTARAFGYHPTELYDFLEKVGYKMYSYKNGILKSQRRLEYYKTQDVYCF